MRVLNPETDQEFYLSRVKGNVPPKHIQRISPVQITIDKVDFDLYSNPRKSQYAYLFIDGWWHACRDHEIASCVGVNMYYVNFGRPFKARTDTQPVVASPAVVEAAMPKLTQSEEPMKRAIRVIKKYQQQQIKN